MKCSLTGHNTRVLAKAINSFSRIGNELYLEATQNGLVLRTVNDSQTAFAVMRFETGFFTDFKIDRSNSDEFCNKCKVSMKSCLSVFKNMRQVEKCQITLNLRTSKLLFQFNCLFDTTKTHNVSILEQESLNAVYMTDNPPNKMTAPNKMFTEIISNFRMYDNEITIEAATDLVVLKNNIDIHTDKHLMRTKLTLKSQEFDGYHISEPTSITFCLKELRAILNFADALSLDMTINFESAGKPVVFAFGSQDMFTANFVMSTLAPEDVPEKNRSIDAAGEKAQINQENKKSRRNNRSESNILTVNHSEVIDLDENVPEVAMALPTQIITNKIKDESNNRTQANRFPATPATSVTSQHNSAMDTLPNRLRSCTPNRQSKNVNQPTEDHRSQTNRFPTTRATTIVASQGNSQANRQPTNTNLLRPTESEEICVSFRPETESAKNDENVNEDDEEVDVIPLSPQPERPKRFRIFPRLYQRTQCPSGNRVIQQNSDDEL